MIVWMWIWAESRRSRDEVHIQYETRSIDRVEYWIGGALPWREGSLPGCAMLHPVHHR